MGLSLARELECPAMVHPFDVERGDDGRIYVSCQDTNTVVSLVPKTRKPASVAAHLPSSIPTGLSNPAATKIMIAQFASAASIQAVGVF
jgi:hypothetical protein